MKRWMIVVVVLMCGCSKEDAAKDSPTNGSAVKSSSPDDPKVKEALTADFKAWVEKTYTTEPHGFVDIAGRESLVTCRFESSIDHLVRDGSIDDSSWVGIVQATGTFGARSFTALGVFQKGDGGWTCRPDDPREEVKLSALQCENLAQYCARTPPPPKVTSLWEYSESVDKMRGTTMKIAKVKSLNEFPISFPTSGMTRLEMRIRQNGTSQDVMLSTTNGPLEPCVPQCTIAAKFGDGPVTEFAAVAPNGAAGEVVFIRNTARWLKLMKAAKLAVIEVSLFNSGRRQFEFAVVGLDWPR